ncbi:MAG: VIT and VWA domain-containing protein, partial [Myxococcota bacterium]|nr:VIT and VWA domain-containing protein [Myxococcota bacterium]
MKRSVFKMLAAAAAAAIAPGTAGAIGIMIPSDRSLGPLAIESHRVEIDITDRAAVTKVDQVFRNSSDRILEATYIFPLPEGSSVSQFALWVNGRRTEGEVLERDAARRIYEEIVARMVDPGLIEYIGGNLFRARVFPIPARGEQRVEIRFTSTLAYESGLVRYVYPMKTPGRSAETLRDFTLTARIESAVPIQSIYSPTHEVGVTRRNDNHATAGFERQRADLGKDFVLYFSVSREDVGLSLLAHRPDREDGFFMMMVTPRKDLDEQEVMGKHVTFVVDTSGSMSGEKMDGAREALRFCLDRLGSDDVFNVIRFSSDVEALSDSPMAASAANKERAGEFVRRMRALGGTAIDAALAKALEQPIESGVPHMIVFLTDGMPTVGETDPVRIVDRVTSANDRKSRIFVFGLGNDVNANFLDMIAQRNRGTAEYARSGEELEVKLSAFYGKIAFPVMANLALRAGRGVELLDVFPRELPDLFHGSQLLLLGRYRGDGEVSVSLGGDVGRQTKTFTYDVGFPNRESDNDFLPHLWATRKVGYLLDNIRLGGENQEVREEVIALGRRYGIVTPYTSYLVTEDQPAPQQIRLGGRDRDDFGPPG